LSVHQQVSLNPSIPLAYRHHSRLASHLLEYLLAEVVDDDDAIDCWFFSLSSLDWNSSDAAEQQPIVTV
jgi:hypothetical protein